MQLWAAQSTRQQRRSKQTIIFITFGSRVWPLRKSEHLQLLFTSAAVVVKNTPLPSSLKHCGAINRALFLQFPSLWELCNHCEGFLLIETLPFAHVRPCLHPSQPPTEVGQVCWEFCELCDGRVPQAATALFLQQLGLRWSCLGGNSSVQLSTGLRELGFIFSDFCRVWSWMPADYSNCRMHSTGWGRAAGNIRDAGLSHTDLAMQGTRDVLLWMQQEVCGKMKDAEF